MALIPINNAGQYGIITDRPGHELALNAWTAGQNVRMHEGAVEKFLGHEQAFGTPSIAPYYLQMARASTTHWIQAGLAKVYAWDGSTHNNITRQSAGVDVDYSATAIKNWTGGALGGIHILNNGVDAPQFWASVNVATRLANLTNWPASYVAGAMRVFRRYLVAMDITKAVGPTRYPQMVKWSAAAPSGGVPASWDETDETIDAAEVELLDTDGALLDGARLRDQMALYKEDAVYWMQYVGGTDVFSIRPMFGEFGALSRRCALEYKRGRHAVLAVGDLITHDGQTWESIVNSRLRRWLFAQINPTYYHTSYVAWNPKYNEVWFCVPTGSATLPNLAVVWNYNTGAIGVRELNNVAHIAAGDVTLVASSDIWDNDTGVWDADSSVWGEGASNPSGLRLLAAEASDTKLQYLDSTNAFAGTAMTAYVERTGLPVPVTPDGPPDMRSRKFVRDLWPRILGTTGGVVQVTVGLQDEVDGSITWQTPQDYTIGTTQHIDVMGNCRLLALRFASSTSIDWKLHGYEVDIVPAGRF